MELIASTSDEGARGTATRSINPAMKILVLGAGATGGYFGGRLTASGADVTFLVRPQRLEMLKKNGLSIESTFDNIKTPVKAVTRELVRESYDLVLLSAKSYDLDSAIDAIRPAMGTNSQILPLLNGIRHLDVLDEAFGKHRVLGGMCHLSVTLAPDGVVRHLNALHLLTYGPRVASQDKLCRAVKPVFEHAGFEAKLPDNVIQAMWGKWVLMATLAGMTCLMRASVGEIMGTRDGRALMLALLDESRAIAAACGEEPAPDAIAHIAGLLTDPASQVVASMRRDMQKGAQIEGDQIVGDMLARGEAKGVAAPLMRIAYANLQAYQNRSPRQPI
jgi:2-dehydropantoate 2-reductase